MAKKKNSAPLPGELRIASLFSGCGGLDLGFSGGFRFYETEFPKLPTKVVFANDFDADAANCYNSNPLLVHDGAQCLLKDIREVDAVEIPDYDILLAGFPCQPFSNAGNRKGVNDDNGRGTLFEECERIIKSKVDAGKAPAAFLFENVRGILSSKMPSGITVPQEIKNRMEDLGYNVSMQLVCASDYGVPQKRYRVLIVGIRKDIGSFDFEELNNVVNSLNLPSEKKGNYERLMVGSILHDIEAIPDGGCWDYSVSTQDMVDNIGPCQHGAEASRFFVNGFNKETLPAEVFVGKSWKDIPYELLTPRFKRIADDPKKYHAPNFFRRFAFGEINGTITASAQPENCGITHPVYNRRYSVREIARIQSFPDDYSFDSIPLQSRYKVIGNAVPPILGWVVARALINQINKK
jgi:DNA (cytosine-5)-methyltransferase 1